MSGCPAPPPPPAARRSTRWFWPPRSWRSPGRGDRRRGSASCRFWRRLFPRTDLPPDPESALSSASIPWRPLWAASAGSMSPPQTGTRKESWVGSEYIIGILTSTSRDKLFLNPRDDPPRCSPPPSLCLLAIVANCCSRKISNASSSSMSSTNKNVKHYLAGIVKMLHLYWRG